MIEFVLIMSICGGMAAFHLTWVFVSLVGLVAIPVFCLVLVLWSGSPIMGAFLKAGAGYVALQVSYVLVGVGIDLFGRRLPNGQNGVRVLAGRIPSRAQAGLPLFGGWLPLLAFYDPPCRRDGTPWDGREDPGFRITTLVFGWFGHGVSVTVGAPRPVPAQNPGPVEQRDAIETLDERIKASRARKDSTE